MVKLHFPFKGQKTGHVTPKNIFTGIEEEKNSKDIIASSTKCKGKSRISINCSGDAQCSAIQTHDAGR